MYVCIYIYIEREIHYTSISIMPETSSRPSGGAACLSLSLSIYIYIYI